MEEHIRRIIKPFSTVTAHDTTQNGKKDKKKRIEKYTNKIIKRKS